MAGMWLRDLGWLVALAEHQHLTDTATRLGVPQPTLSRALARIERELGTRVFERVPDGLRTTPTGAIVVTAARDLTARHEQLLSDVRRELDPDTGVVRLAFLDSMATSLVPQVLRACHTHAPGIRVLLSQEPGHEIVADLRSGAVDLAITSARPPGDHGWHPLQEERLVVVVPARHRWRGRRRLRLAELDAEELVTTPLGFGYRRLVDDLLHDAGAAPRISFESQDLATIEGLVAAGLGVAILPEPLAGLSGTVGIAIAGGAARREIGLTWRSDRPLPPPAALLRDFVVASR
jgi:LysR family transcriptional activator of glutamate synthase operon